MKEIFKEATRGILSDRVTNDDFWLRGPSDTRGFRSLLIEREHDGGHEGMKKMLCLKCLYHGTNSQKCPKCNIKMTHVDSRARFPRKNQKRKWKNFFELFKPF